MSFLSPSSALIIMPETCKDVEEQISQVKTAINKRENVSQNKIQQELHFPIQKL